MFTVRRGFGRIGYAALAVWEVACCVLFVQERNSAAAVWILAVAFIAPAAVWAAWQALLWILAGFYSPRDRSSQSR